jgi:hypothetical protein
MLCSSLALIGGATAGWSLGVTVGSCLQGAIALIVLVTTILLWATLAVLGWNFQSWGGVSLSDRLNQWIFRALYFVGTALISAGSVWSVY